MLSCDSNDVDKMKTARFGFMQEHVTFRKILFITVVYKRVFISGRNIVKIEERRFESVHE